MAKAYIAADKMSLPTKRKLEAKLEAAAEPTQEAAAFPAEGAALAPVEPPPWQVAAERRQTAAEAPCIATRTSSPRRQHTNKDMVTPAEEEATAAESVAEEQEDEEEEEEKVEEKRRPRSDHELLMAGVEKATEDTKNIVLKMMMCELPGRKTEQEWIDGASNHRAPPQTSYLHHAQFLVMSCF
jgi:hypothetical protein